MKHSNCFSGSLRKRKNFVSVYYLRPGESLILYTYLSSFYSILSILLYLKILYSYNCRKSSLYSHFFFRYWIKGAISFYKKIENKETSTPFLRSIMPKKKGNKTWLTCTSKCVVVSCGCGGPCCCCCCCEGGGPCGGGACAPKSCAAACECGCCRWWVGGAWWCCRWCGGANAAMKCSSLPTTSTPGFSSTTPPPPALTARVAAAFFWNSSSPGDGWRLPGVRLQWKCVKIS